MMKRDNIRFVAGKYAGKHGWIDLTGHSEKGVTHVIVDLSGKGEKVTYVYTSSFRKMLKDKPSCYTQAVIQQCPDIEKNLVNVSRQLAKCNIKKDMDGFKQVVNGHLKEAMVWQEQRGSKAMFWKITYNNKNA